MIYRAIRRRLDHLRDQPEPVRLRAATLLTAGTGGVLVVLWLAVLLPLQIKLTAPDKPEEATTAQNTTDTNVPALTQGGFPARLPQETVAGTQSTPLFAPLPQATTDPAALIEATPSPSPTNNLSLPVEVQP